MTTTLPHLLVLTLFSHTLEDWKAFISTPQRNWKYRARIKAFVLVEASKIRLEGAMAAHQYCKTTR